MGAQSIATLGRQTPPHEQHPYQPNHRVHHSGLSALVQPLQQGKVFAFSSDGAYELAKKPPK